VKHGYADTEWGQIHYKRAEGPGPTIIFIHEMPLSSEIYAPIIDPLGETMDVIAFDVPGYGGSYAPDHGLEIPEYATRLLAAIDALGIEEFIIAGCHTGAAIGVDIARQAGMGRVKKAVLTGLPLLDPKERDWWLANWAPSMEPKEDGSHLQWAWERYDRIWDADIDVELEDMAVMQILRALPRYNWGYRAAFSHDPGPGVEALTCPTLLINAERDHMAHTDQQVLGMLKDGTFIQIPGLGGQLPWRATDEFVKHVRKFVAA
jgi:haloalkane dehalogenase